MPGPRLTVAVISAGAVGTAVGEALERAGHSVTAVVARSGASRARAALRLPGARVTESAADAAADAELIVIAVPDPTIPEVVEAIAPHVGAGRIVVHVAGSRGRAVLDPLALAGALTIAAHPAMTFAGVAEDTDRLAGCPWGVTVGDELSRTVAELLISELGGRAIPIPENHRPLYHAAMAHGSNHLVTLVSEALRILDHALADPGEGQSGVPVAENPDSAVLLRRILPATLAGVLDRRAAALTGPTARDDAATVLRHLDALLTVDAGGQPLAASYREAALRTARSVGSLNVERALDGDYPY